MTIKATKEINRKPSLLITASTYPNDLSDPTPQFVHQLARELTSSFDTHVLAPSTPISSRLAISDSIKIHRFRYFIKKLELLCYKNAIMENIKQNKANLLLIFPLVISQCLSIRKIILSNKIDVINAHWIIPQGLCAVLSNILFFRNKKKILITAHGGDVFSLPILNPLKTWILKNSDHIFVVSNAIKSYCVDTLHINSNSISVVPMGVDLTQLFTPPTSSFRDKKIIFIGRLAEKKGIDVLLRAVKILKDKGVNTDVDIIGEGSLKEGLIDLTKQLGIENFVTFRGGLPHHELPNELRKHQIFVFPSIIAKSGDREGLGLTAIEAMGCGCLVIASDLDTTKDFIQNGVTGFTFNAGNEKDLADKISAALDLERNDIQKNARVFVENTYDWEGTIQKYINRLQQQVLTR